jgi:hypothetical protein
VSLSFLLVNTFFYQCGKQSTESKKTTGIKERAFTNEQQRDFLVAILASTTT